jgi:ubiquinone/menaquinone biosynthesis C-methylase UbiE
VQKALAEVSKVLKPGGVFICISYGQPQHREHLFNQPELDFSVTVQKISKPTITTSITIANDDRDYPNLHFVYICKKVQADSNRKEERKR